jgi:endonuclease/exonuclease/phosphatase family metal-dependent hydrolase
MIIGIEPKLMPQGTYMRIRKLINIVVIAALSIGLVGFQHMPVQAATGELSMTSWNVRGFHLGDNEIRNLSNLDDPNTLVGQIRQRGIEYIGFQEISDAQAYTIAYYLGWGTDTAHLRTVFEHWGGTTGNYSEGIAMISKYPISDYTSVKLSPEGKGRKLQRAKIVKENQTYYAYNTHLGSDDWGSDINANGNKRNQQAQFVLNQINTYKSQVNNSSAVFLLGGDMNSRAIQNNTTAGLAYQTLAAGMTDTWLYQHPNANVPTVDKTECREPERPECGNTVTIRTSDADVNGQHNGMTQNPTIRIDYFFVSKDKNAFIRTTDTPQPVKDDETTYKTFSDHFPYRLTLTTYDPSSVPTPIFPVSKFTWSRLSGANNPVSLDGGGSYDPDGSITKWQWFVDGNALPLTSAKGTVNLGAGTTKTVKLTVTDNSGLTTSSTQTLSLPNRAPTIGAYTPNGVVVPSTQPTLTASGSDPDGDSLKYFFNVMTTSGTQVAYSGWGGNSWTIPAYKLDPGTKYNWTVTVEDTGSLQAQRAGSFTVAMLPTSADVTATSTGQGYWIVDTYGNVYTYGDARYFGTLHDVGVNVSNITGLVRTPDNGGYWIVGSDGGVYAFGNARFYGSMGGQHLNAPVVGMAATKNGQGYWLVAADGGIFAYGNAGFFGSMGGQPLNGAVVAMAATPSNNGYWLAAKDGGIFAFGDAPFYGSMGGQPLNYPVVDMDTTPDGQGYWMTAQDGGVFAFGDAGFYGSMAGKPLNGRITGMAVTATGGGYWLNGCDGGIFAFGDAPFYGSNPTYMCAGI